MEAIKMLPVTPTCLVTSNVIHFSSMDACPGPNVSQVLFLRCVPSMSPCHCPC